MDSPAARGNTSPQQPDVASLGAPFDRFQPGTANLAAGIILGILFIAGGVAIDSFIVRDVARNQAHMPFYADRGSSWFFAGLGVLLGAGLAVGGGFLIWWVRSLASLQILFCPFGFYCASARKTTAFAWDLVKEVHEIIVHERLPVVKGVAQHAMPTKTSHSYVVHRRDGVSFVFDGNSVREIDRLGTLLRDEAQKRGIAWKIIEDPA